MNALQVQAVIAVAFLGFVILWVTVIEDRLEDREVRLTRESRGDGA